MDIPQTSLPRSRRFVFSPTHVRSRFQEGNIGSISSPSLLLTSLESNRIIIPDERDEVSTPEPTPVSRKTVYRLTCNDCSIVVCARGRKNSSPANGELSMYSTDTPSRDISTLQQRGFYAHVCYCRLQNFACLNCGNVLGYHVIAPCGPCLYATRSGHLWMFYADSCQASKRLDVNSKALHWLQLPKAHKDIEFILGSEPPYDKYCR